MWQGVAFELGVHFDQSKTSFLGVVIFDRSPGVVVMALITFDAKSKTVIVVRSMTTGTGRGQLGFIVAAAMAVGAINVGVLAYQGEMRFAFMIIGGGMPFGRRMALGAIIATRSLMHIIGGVAAHAAARRLLVMTADVTGIAAQRLVRSRQSVVGLAVVKLATRPAVGSMTGVAILPELPDMQVVAMMAAVTAGRRLAPQLTVLVAAIAGQRPVPAFQGKSSRLMVKRLHLEAHDVGLTPQVFAVAGIALAALGIGHQAMQAAVAADVGGDFLVTGQAQRGLSIAIAAIVAIGAFLLVLGMLGTQLAGIEQGFERRRGRGSHQL